jgi:hypothetical protein
MSSHAPEVRPHLRLFVLPYEPVEPARSGELDLYLPASKPAAAVLMVHGGPVPRDREVRPPQWPAYRGYGALLARAGLVCGMFEHGFVDDETLGRALENVPGGSLCGDRGQHVETRGVAGWPDAGEHTSGCGGE